MKTDNLLIDGSRVVGLDAQLSHENTVAYDMAPSFNHLRLLRWSARGLRRRRAAAIVAENFAQSYSAAARDWTLPVVWLRALPAGPDRRAGRLRRVASVAHCTVAGAHRARQRLEYAREKPMSASSGRRLTKIDSLRGIAALAVLSFHFTTRYDEIYRFSGYLPFHAPWGYLGVNLFFVISGFVIYMTLDRTDVGADFLVSRFSRLYPAYWTAIALTFCITSLLGLPGKAVPWHIAVLNIPMIQMLFSVPMVDGVYWTLLVELLFYGLAYALFAARRMNYVLHALCALFALRLIYWGFANSRMSTFRGESASY